MSHLHESKITFWEERAGGIRRGGIECAGVSWYHIGMSVPDFSPWEIPPLVRPLLWSYDVARMDAERDRAVIIAAIVNYGDLIHWQWMIRRYGKAGVREALMPLPAGALRAPAQRLAKIVFGMESFFYAPRSAH